MFRRSRDNSAKRVRERARRRRLTRSGLIGVFRQFFFVFFFCFFVLFSAVRFVSASIPFPFSVASSSDRRSVARPKTAAARNDKEVSCIFHHPDRSSPRQLQLILVTRVVRTTLLLPSYLWFI